MKYFLLLRNIFRGGSVSGLCTNSCPVSDLWSNCRELVEEMGDWVCHNNHYANHCRATCNCKHAIL